MQTKGGPITRKTMRVQKGSRLHDLSGAIEGYKNLVGVDVDANRGIIERSNGDIITAGQVTQDVTDDVKRRIQIREVIREVIRDHSVEGATGCVGPAAGLHKVTYDRGPAGSKEPTRRLWGSRGVNWAR